MYNMINSMSVKLSKIVPSTNNQKKLDAHFEINSKRKKISFGSKNSTTYINHKDANKKKTISQDKADYLGK